MNQSLSCYHSDHPCSTAIDFLMLLHNYCYTLLDYTMTSQHLDHLDFCRAIIYFADAVSQWHPNFEHYLGQGIQEWTK